VFAEVGSVSGRPEGSDRGGYNDTGAPFDEDAWQEFTPWRSGDPSTAGEAPSSWTGAGAGGDGRRGPARPAEAIERSDGRGPQRAAPAEPEQPQRAGRWWTEDATRRYSGGEKITSTGAIGGPFMSHVQAGTRGEVVARRETLLGGDRLTVRFENGYVEKDVKPEQIERRGWLS
jgi:hypothetical protein